MKSGNFMTLHCLVRTETGGTPCGRRVHPLKSKRVLFTGTSTVNTCCKMLTHMYEYLRLFYSTGNVISDKFLEVEIFFLIKKLYRYLRVFCGSVNISFGSGSAEP
jgi:hypothetical protein